MDFGSGSRLSLERERGRDAGSPAETRAFRRETSMGTMPGHSAMSGAEILVVEDDPGSGETLVDILETEGYRVAWVLNGEEALEYLCQRPLPRLILLDVILPRLDGFAFRWRQMEDPALANIPVVVMTGVYDSPTLAYSIAAADYFVKPYNVNELLSTVARYCGRGGEG
jgi:CheY-like chemotaxis protein